MTQGASQETAQDETIHVAPPGYATAQYHSIQALAQKPTAQPSHMAPTTGITQGAVVQQNNPVVQPGNTTTPALRWTQGAASYQHNTVAPSENATRPTPSMTQGATSIQPDASITQEALSHQPNHLS